MATHRKNEAAAVRFEPALIALVACVFIGGSGIGYVGQKNQLHILGAQFKERELRLDKLRRENEGLVRVLDSLQSPIELETRVKLMNLGLGAPQPGQIVRLVERPPEAIRQGTERLYVEQKIQANDHP
ncbi:MAG: hypothetical protein EXS30_06700 [Pedosphaera sp.]|nr:hypothetical protein [Pedosphaera sp.]